MGIYMYIVIQIDVSTKLSQLLFTNQRIENCIKYIIENTKDKIIVRQNKNGSKFYEVYVQNIGYIYNSKSLKYIIQILSIKNSEKNINNKVSQCVSDTNKQNYNISCLDEHNTSNSKKYNLKKKTYANIVKNN